MKKSIMTTKAIFAFIITLPFQIIQTISVGLALLFAMIDVFVKKFGIMLGGLICGMFEKETVRYEIKCEIAMHEKDCIRSTGELFKEIYR